MDRAEYEALVARVRSAAEAYYNSDQLLMPDSEYDALVDQVATAQAEHPEWAAGGVLTQVAAGVGVGTVRHSSPMMSLAKVTTDEALHDWLMSLRGAMVVIEPKLDGLAVSAIYEKGILVRVVTRGDGTSGEDVTSQAHQVSGLPQQLRFPVDLEVRGEVYMTNQDFETANANRMAAGKPAFANPRNATAGSLRAQDRTYAAPMSFSAYEASGDDDSYRARLQRAFSLGVSTVTELLPVMPQSIMPPAGPVAAYIEEIHAMRSDLPYPIDGAVVKVDSTKARQALGTTSHTPKWAMAYKYPADTAITTLLDIELAIGRTGRLSVTAVLEPVFVGGTTISRATLHHPQFILDADLRIGDRVYVYRAGDVIPRVTTPDLTARPAGLAKWQPPDNCPQCGEPLFKNSLLWRCGTPECSTVGRIVYFASRDVMDVDGLDTATAEALVESGLVNDIADLFSLTLDKLAQLQTGEGRMLGHKTAARILSGLDQAKSQPLARVITSLGIRKVGRTMGRRLAERFRSMAALRQATIQELGSVEGIGELKAATIWDGLRQMDPVIDRLVAAGVQTEMGVPTVGGAAGPLTGKTVVVTGVVPGLTRNEADMAILQMGGNPAHSVSKKTDLVVIGDGAGSKADKARELGIPIMDASDFAEAYAQSN